MKKFKKELKERFKDYVATKLNSDKSPPPFMYFTETCKAAQTLIPQYDLGIELATDGLYPGYIFQLHGFPTKAVKLGRKGRGATWQPLEKLNAKDIKGKRILVFDNDVVTGRTLNRTVKELGAFSPEYMDLLLIHESTMLTVDSYKKWNKNHSIPAVEDSYSSFTPTNIRETSEGLEFDYFRDRERYPITMQLGNDDYLSLNVRRNVPREVRKVMTISKDFKDDSGQGIINLEKILRDK